MSDSSFTILSPVQWTIPANLHHWVCAREACDSTVCRSSTAYIQGHPLCPRRYLLIGVNGAQCVLLIRVYPFAFTVEGQALKAGTAFLRRANNSRAMKHLGAKNNSLKHVNVLQNAARRALTQAQTVRRTAARAAAAAFYETRQRFPGPGGHWLCLPSGPTADSSTGNNPVWMRFLNCAKCSGEPICMRASPMWGHCLATKISHRLRPSSIQARTEPRSRIDI